MKTRFLKTNRSTKQGQRTALFLQPEDRFHDHIRIEERSIALHRAIADRIRKNPRLMDKARKNLQKYLDQFAQENRTAPKSLTEWQDILTNRPGEAVLEFLVSSGETAGRLRQSSPFAGILTPKERWKIYEAYRPGAYYPSRRQHHPR
jgi:hypothetical protein